MENSLQLVQSLKGLFASQSLAVLATQSAGQPYGNLVAFVATEDLKYFLFATDRSTRKFANVTGNPRVAMVIDNRSNKVEDFQEAIAVTVTGKVEEVHGADKGASLERYLTKHPNLKTFVTSPNCALLRIGVETYYVVGKFQDVTVMSMR